MALTGLLLADQRPQEELLLIADRLAHVDANGKAAQKQALATRGKLLHRIAPRSMNGAVSIALALPFLGGMESPPRAG